MKNMKLLPDAWDGRENGDPFLMRWNGLYYLYCSSVGKNPHGMKCWTSEDLVSYQYKGLVCEDDRVWGAYAPEVMYVKGFFYMVTSPRGSGHYLLRADHPLGPFEVLSENLGLMIDGSIFVDSDGREYFLRAGHKGIRIHDMPTPETIAAHSALIAPSDMKHWTEGPMMIKRDHRYFLTYTGNHTLSRGYAVDYSVSSINPKTGYRNMKNRTLLLETEDPFYTLGHSSTCLAPDMASYYIAYHNNEFDSRGTPLGRKYNLDRLFFNGDRMYANATFWEQCNPARPMYETRDGQSLMDGNGRVTAPVAVPDIFVTEWNVLIGSENTLAAGSASLTIRDNGEWILSERKQLLLTGTLAPIVALDALLCVRIAFDGKTLRCWVNDLQLACISASVQPGAMFAQGAKRVKYMAISTASDVADRQWEKAVPGVFDAVHALNADDYEQSESELGCMGLRLAGDQSVVFNVNAAEAGQYHIALCLYDGGIAKWVRYDTVTLPKGNSELKIRAKHDMLLDRVMLVRSAPVTPVTVIDGGEDVSGGKLSVLGHKGKQSMLRKYSGFTCAENQGTAYIGDAGWDDYSIDAQLYLDPKVDNGEISVFVRVSRESWYPHQVAPSRWGYCIRIRANGIQLLKNTYNEVPLYGLDVRMPADGMLALGCQVRSNTITVTLNGTQVIRFTDPEAYLYGKVGLECKGEGCGIQAFSIGWPD